MQDERPDPVSAELKRIEDRISGEQFDVISFDVFDTLIMRAVEKPGDVWELMDREFAELEHTEISFAGLRSKAEAVLRRKVLAGELQKEEITLDEIYAELTADFGMRGETARRMKEAEYLTERQVCRARRSAAELYRHALAAGKRVIAVSDMYLSADQVRGLLHHCGYKEIEEVYVSSELGKQKRTGSLFRAVSVLTGTAPARILHIGDSEETDVRTAELQGYSAEWLPAAAEAYEKHGCAHQAEKICADLTDWEAARNCLGIGIMRSLAAQKYFDDPFRAFDPASDYNGDPYFVGYGALGMEILALVRWLADNIDRDRIGQMIFTARDGWLPLQAYEMYRQYHRELPTAAYLYASRLSMLPAVLKTPADLFDIPTDLAYQSVRKLFRLLDFCTAEGAAEDYEKRADSGRHMDEPLNAARYTEFISCFIRDYYDRAKHERSVGVIRDYLQKSGTAVTDRAAIWDMGYSGRTASAIIELCGQKPKIYYFNTDTRSHYRYEKKLGVRIRSFFDFSPYMEAALREYAYSGTGPSCIGYTADHRPVFDTEMPEVCGRTAQLMQQGALDFLRDYLELFSGYEQETGFRSHDAAMPFEAFLRFAVPADRRMYEEVLLDDELWGGRRDINLRRLMEARLKKLPEYAKDR